MESQSYILGQFVAIMHICEYTVSSEENTKLDDIIDEFISDPMSTFVNCQTKIAMMYRDLVDLEKNILVNEIRRIYQELDNDNTKNILLDKTDFSEGYQIQLCWSKYVNI